MIDRIVDLPQPEWPRMQTNSPSWIAALTFSTATTGPSGVSNVLLKPVSSSGIRDRFHVSLSIGRAVFSRRPRRHDAGGGPGESNRRAVSPVSSASTAVAGFGCRRR